jgi:hypothetical protein
MEESKPKQKESECKKRTRVFRSLCELLNDQADLLLIKIKENEIRLKHKDNTEFQPK